VTKHNTHTRQIPMHPAGFKPAITTTELPKIHALDRAATGMSMHL